MIVVTAPTGQIGSKLVGQLLEAEVPVRVIARDPAGLGSDVRDRVDIVAGSHRDPAVLDLALPGADAVFWLVPPDPTAPSAEAHYRDFARAGAEAIRRHGVGHLVSVSSAGHGWPKPAGVLSAAFAMDEELGRSGAAFRALCMPFYMENLFRSLDELRRDGAFSLTFERDRPLPLVATADIAATAAGLLRDLTWGDEAEVPVFGPDRLTPDEMAVVMTEALGRPIGYRQTSLDDLAAALAERGAAPEAVQDTVGMLAAPDEGIYEADWEAASPTRTDFRTWCEQVLRDAVGD